MTEKIPAIDHDPMIAAPFIREKEGLRLKAYRCSAGVSTIGYGHTGDVPEGQEITKERAEGLLKTDVRQAASYVVSAVRECTEGQFIALVSLVFNVGPTAFKNSRLVAKLNAGDIEGAADEFDNWVYAKNPKTGKKEISLGLKARRADEKEMFLSDNV